ncbi:hypothetical protein V6N12_063795 [Hibiscus sabdariffa]|uniref:Uncharacterized protein n=1 Tax=Hibiscus sabdariffa TaxID=183260 RepID=A0ABR2AVI3_9ROSI
MWLNALCHRSTSLISILHHRGSSYGGALWPGWCFDYVQYGDWLRVAPKKPQEGSSLPRGRIRYHDVGSLSNVPSNDLGKGAAKANLNHEATVVKLGTPLDVNLGENMTDDNMVEDLLDTDSIGTEQGPTLFDAYIATSPIATRKDEATIVASLVAAGTVVFAVSTLEVLSGKVSMPNSDSNQVLLDFDTWLAAQHVYYVTNKHSKHKTGSHSSMQSSTISGLC